MLDYEYVNEWRLYDAIEARKASRKANTLRRRKRVYTALVGLLGGILMIACSINWDALYSATGTVVETTETEIVVEVGEDLYAYEGNGHQVGDSVVLIMNDCGTRNRSDDIIIAER